MPAISARRARRTHRARLVLAVLAALTVAALLGRSAEPVRGADCVVVPTVRGTMLVDQGLSSYANSPLVRGHDTLVKVTLSGPQTLPSCATTGASAFLTGATVSVSEGSRALSTAPVQATPVPVSPFPPIAPFATTPPVNSPGDPIFRVPSDVLEASTTAGRFTATFTATITYQSRASATAPLIAGSAPVTVSRNVTVEARTNGWRLLVIPMGVPGQPEQFSPGAEAAVASGMQTLARLSAVPKGTASGTAALGAPRGAVRYTVNRGDLVDVTSSLVDAAGAPTTDVVNGKFCGKSTNFAPIEAQLGQFLNVWNTVNPSLAADKAVGASDELKSRGGAGCAEGMARVNSNTAWVRAMYVTGSPLRTGAVLGMETMHMLGGVPDSRDDNFSPAHSAKTPADGAVGDANTGFNVGGGTFLSDDRSAMKLSSATAWLDSNTLYEPADWLYSFCAFGGTATTECRAAVPAPLGNAAAAPIESFVMSGTTGDTAATTHVVESYAADQQPGPLDPDGPYFLEYQNAAGQVLNVGGATMRFGVPVFEFESHHDEDTGDSGNQAIKVFSGAIPFPGAAENLTSKVVFYKQGSPGRVVLFSLDRSTTTPQIVGTPITTGGGGGATLGRTDLMSDSAGQEGNSPSNFPDISGDGRFITFQSNATNLVTTDRGSIFVRDVVTGEMEQVDYGLAGVANNGTSANPTISHDGRYVAFDSTGSNLVAGDTNDAADVFVHDRQTGNTVRASLNSAGNQLAGASSVPDISGDGKHVAFQSTFVSGPGDTNGGPDVFVKDLDTGGLFRISDSAVIDGAGNEPSQDPSISADGNVVTYESLANDLVSGGSDTNDQLDVYAYTRTPTPASVVLISNSDFGNGGRNPIVSADGSTFVFESDANLAGTESDEDSDVYARGLEDVPHLISQAVDVDGIGGPGLARSASGDAHTVAVSANGDFVAFSTAASNLLAGDQNGVSDIYVRDRNRRENIRASVGVQDVEGDGDSGGDLVEDLTSVSMTADGRKIAFRSRAKNFVTPASSGSGQIYVREPAAPASACSISQHESLVSETASEIMFLNHTSRTVDIYWLDFAGERVLYNTLEPNGSYTQSTWLTHPWVAVDRITGRCYGYTISDQASKTYEITEGGGGDGEQEILATVTDDKPVKADVLLACPVTGGGVENHVVDVGVEPTETEAGTASFSIPTDASCPGGQFKLAFNDGVNRTALVSAGSPVITPVTSPPIVAITNPRPGEEFLSSRAVVVWGSGRSEEDGALEGSRLSWAVRNAGGVVATATGANPSFVLGAGSYTLALTGTDQDGLTSTVERSIVVLQDADKDGIPVALETSLPCVAAGATGPPDNDPLNAFKDGDLDGKLNQDEVSTGTAPCVKQTSYEGIALFVPATVDVSSTDRTFSAQGMKVDYVDMRDVVASSVRIVNLAGFDVSANPAFRTTGYVGYKEYAAAAFDRRAITAFLRSKEIPHTGLASEQVDIVVGGQGVTRISGQPNHNWTFNARGTFRAVP
jgi:von Hippel-Lindau disease tumor suppressor protein/WD40 repeat protein